MRRPTASDGRLTKKGRSVGTQAAVPNSHNVAPANTRLVSLHVLRSPDRRPPAGLRWESGGRGRPADRGADSLGSGAWIVGDLRRRDPLDDARFVDVLLCADAI